MAAGMNNEVKADLASAKGAPKMPDGLPGATQRTNRDFATATEALRNSDASRLYDLWEESVKNQSDLLAAMGLLAEDRKGSAGIAQRYSQDPGAVGAMKEVALAAIELARSFSPKSKELAEHVAGTCEECKRMKESREP